MQQIADDMGAQFSEYDDKKSVIVVPLKDGRFQTVMGVLKHHEKYDREIIQFTTKVCDTSQFIHFAHILSRSADFIHTKFVVLEGFLRVEAASYLDNISDGLLKEMIQEVAEIGDEWELEITGQDIH